MSEINYQALREVAERAIPAMECLLMLPADDDLLSEQELKITVWILMRSTPSNFWPDQKPCWHYWMNGKETSNT
ncbi:hypothetical protein WEG_02669 [Escherichia coli KTE24]|nr:hypothetical protein WEG_02669 [Escherichia coli KTE24]